VKILNNELLLACKELIDYAKLEKTDLYFKEACIEILAKAKPVLTDNQFKELSLYAAERMKEAIEQ